MGASQSSSSLATAAHAHRSGGPADRRRWAHSFPREPRRDRDRDREGPLPLPPHCKVLPAALPTPRLHRTHNGDILHSGGTLTGRRPMAPGQANGGLVRVRSQSQPRRPDYGGSALFGSEPDLRFTTTSPHQHQHHHIRALSRDHRDDSPAKLRISRSRKKYKAPAPPPGTLGADSSSPDSYQWEQHANTPVRRNRLFKTRAETKKATGGTNVAPHPVVIEPPARVVSTLQRSLSSPEFQAELLEVARRLRSSSSSSTAAPAVNGRCSPGGERERPVGEAAVEPRQTNRHRSESPAMRRSQGSGRESTPEPRIHVRENSQPSRGRPSVTNHWEILPKAPERREVPSRSFYFGMNTSEAEVPPNPVEPPQTPKTDHSKQRSAAVRDREVERFAAEIRRAPITASTTLTSGSGSLSSEADQDDDGNIEGIALQLRPTLPKKRLEIPRFSPTAAWRLLSALDSTSLAPPPPLGDAVDALEERITRLARPTAPPPAPQMAAAVVAARGSHDKSGDSGISGDASPVGGHEDSLDPPAHHNRKGLLSNKPLMAWTPLQDLEGEEESSSDGEGAGAPGSAGPIKFSPRSQLFSLSLPREYSAVEAGSGKTWNALPEESPTSFHSLRTARRSSGREEPTVETESPTSRPLDGNWLLSRSVPSSLNLQNGGDSWRRSSPKDSDEIFPETRLMKQPSFSYLATGGHVMYLPESAGRRNQLPPRDNRDRASSADATSRKIARKRTTKSCDRIESKDVDLQNEMREIGGSAPGSPQRDRVENNVSGFESNPGLRKALERKMRPKKFTFQSTVRQIERRRTAERLSRDAELKEQQRLSELEAMRRVEEEFQRKRAREKANIRHQLRLFSLEDSTAFSSLPADWPNGARDDPDGAPAPAAPGSSNHGDTKSPSTQVLSEFRENRRQYREYRPSRTPECGADLQTSEPGVRRSMVHPEAVFDIPKNTPVYVATHHTSGGIDERGTSTPRSSSSDNYRKDFAHGALPTGRSLASSDSDMSRPGSRQGPSRIRVLQRSRSASPRGRQKTYSSCGGSSVRSSSPPLDGATNLTDSTQDNFDNKLNEKRSSGTTSGQVPTDSHHEDGLEEPLKTPLMRGLQPFGRHSKEYRPVAFRPNKLAQTVN